jgi:hypothetical protein
MTDAIDVLGATTVMLGSGVIVDTPGNYLIEITPGKFEYVFGIDDNDRGCGGECCFHLHEGLRWCSLHSYKPRGWECRVFFVRGVES